MCCYETSKHFDVWNNTYLTNSEKKVCTKGHFCFTLLSHLSRRQEFGQVYRVQCPRSSIQCWRLESSNSGMPLLMAKGQFKNWMEHKFKKHEIFCNEVVEVEVSCRNVNFPIWYSRAFLLITYISENFWKCKQKCI